MDSPLIVVGLGLLSLFISQSHAIFDKIPHATRLDRERSSFRVQVVISLVVLAAALYIIMFEPDASDATQKWAIGAIGTLLGFWLKRS